MRWWLRVELDDGTCSEHELPKEDGASWRVGASRSCDVRLPHAGLRGEVVMDRRGGRWLVSAPGATTLRGSTGLVGKVVRHGDGFRVTGARMSLVMRGEWDEGAAFGGLREALHASDWQRAVGELYRWPRADATSYRRAEDYARDLISQVEFDDEVLEGDGLRELWRSLKARR